jgi:hypothetical protein
VFVDWRRAGFYGLDTEGTAWLSTDGGATWEGRGDAGGPPGALAVTEDGQLFAANKEAVVTSQDGGRTFRTVISYATPAHR